MISGSLCTIVTNRFYVFDSLELPRVRSMSMDILVVCPDSYDRWAFERVEGHRFHFVDAGISHWEASPEFDPVAYLDGCRVLMKEQRVGAVVSTHDLGDLIAAVLAEEAGLPGPSAAAGFLCLH